MHPADKADPDYPKDSLGRRRSGRQRKGEVLSPLMAKAVEIIATRGLPVKDALREAGYADPDVETTRFLSNPAVQRALVSALQRHAVSDLMLTSRAKKTLYKAMTASETPTRDGVTAACKWLDHAHKCGLKTVDAEKRDGVDRTLEQLASEIVGKATPAVEPPPDMQDDAQQSDPEPDPTTLSPMSDDQGRPLMMIPGGDVSH